MDASRPLHNDRLLAELAALDEQLRKPVEPAERAEAAKRVAAANRVEAANPAPRFSRAREFVRAETSAVDVAPDTRDTLDTRDTRDTHETEAPHVTRRWLGVAVLWVGALSIGLLGGGLLGWWHATHPGVEAPPAESRAAAAADEAAIKATLRQYAIAGAASRHLNLGRCDIGIRAVENTATASCDGTIEYARKAGETRVRRESRQWTFTLNKTQDAWRIESVDATR